MKKNMIRGSKGITLIALVITIIVLLILAMVSIAILTGDNGILTQAINAEEENEKAAAEEKLRLALIEYRAQKYTDNKELKEFLENHKDISSVEGDTAPYTVIVDGYQVEVDANGEYNENNFQLAGPRPQVENILITTDGTTEPADGSLTEGTTVQINFDTSIEGGTIKSISPQLPYTTNGTDKEIEFTIVGTVNGVDYTLTKKVSVESKYKQLTEIEKAGVTPEIEVFSETENTEIRDQYNNKIMIPAGFGIASGTGADVTKGVVIEDKENGNQFVWVPVGDINNNGTNVNIELSRYEFGINGETTKKGLADDINSEGSYNDYNYLEEQTSTQGNTVAKNLGEFISKTNATGGYYIARYEASSSDGTQDGKAQIKANEEAWVNITQPNAAIKSKEMYENEAAFTSDLINSLAWDTAIVYIQTFSEDKEYSQTTHHATDEEMNIINMASNMSEWTTETLTRPYFKSVYRGGNYAFSDYAASYRTGFTTSDKFNYTSFRSILYM